MGIKITNELLFHNFSHSRIVSPVSANTGLEHMTSVLFDRKRWRLNTTIPYEVNVYFEKIGTFLYFCLKLKYLHNMKILFQFLKNNPT